MFREEVNMFGVMEEYMMENGFKIKCMVKESFIGQMEINI